MVLGIFTKFVIMQYLLSRSILEDYDLPQWL
jgi:hypothetical protein